MVVCLLKRRQQHGWTCPQLHENSLIFCYFEQFHVGSSDETQKSQRQVRFRVKNDVTVCDLEPGPARSTSLISVVSDLAPICQNLHHHVARRCTCGQRAFRASVCAFSLNSSWVSVPSSTWTSLLFHCLRLASEAARSSLEAAHMRSKPRARAKQQWLLWSPTKLTIEFDKVRDVPDETVTAPAVCQVCTATFLANDDTACQWVRHGSARSLPRGCRRRINELA